MQSSTSGSFARALQNPTVLAMLGSAGFHAILVVISALKPAEGQPQRFQIVNLPPRASTNQPSATPGGSNLSGSNLPVPNGLPPVNLDNVPQFGALPDLSAFNIPSQSFFAGSNSGVKPSSIDLNKLRTMDLPQRSFPNAQRPKSGWPTVPNGFTPLQPPNTAQLPNVDPQGNSPSSRPGPNNSQFSAGDSRLASRPPSSFSVQDILGISGQQFPQPSPTPSSTAILPNTPGSESSGSRSASPSSGTSSLEARGTLDRWRKVQSLQSLQDISLQSGPPLVATYPAESCSSKQNGSAKIAAIYGPNGSLSTGKDAIQIVESAPDVAMNQAAIAAVSTYRPQSRGIYQAFTFKVDIPYSAAVCQSAQPTPASTQAPKKSPKSSPSASPKPSEAPSTPSNAVPSAPPQSASPNPTKPAASEAPSPLSTPAPASDPSPSPVLQAPPESPNVPTPEASDAPPVVPPASPASEAAPSVPTLESVPSPSIAVPESTPAPATP
jgi:hypothetical protein